MPDVIVVGARVAGAATALLLARRGRSVVMVDRADLPSDTVSTHCVQPPGVAALQRWGLLDRLTATGCPPIDTFTFDFGPFVIGTLRTGLTLMGISSFLELIITGTVIVFALIIDQLQQRAERRLALQQQVAQATTGSEPSAPTPNDS